MNLVPFGVFDEQSGKYRGNVIDAHGVRNVYISEETYRYCIDAYRDALLVCCRKMGVQLIRAEKTFGVRGHLVKAGLTYYPVSGPVLGENENGSLIESESGVIVGPLADDELSLFISVGFLSIVPVSGD